MKKLLINAFLGAACLLSCIEASGMNRKLINEQQKINAIVDKIRTFHIKDKKNETHEADREIAMLEGDLYPYFCRAIEVNDFELAEKIFLNDNIDVNQPNAQGIYPLMFALKNKNFDCINFLLDNGAGFFGDDEKLLTDSAGNNLLYYAICGGIPMVRWLLGQSGANLNATFYLRTQEGFVELTPLMLAFQNKDLKMAQFLINIGAKLFDENGQLIADSKGNNLLYYAVCNKPQMTKWFLSYMTNVDLDAPCRLGKEWKRCITPLAIALKDKRWEIAQLLIQAGAKLFDKKGQLISYPGPGNPCRRNVLYYALENNQFTTLQFLLSQPEVSFDSLSRCTMRPLLIEACQLGSIEAINYLIDELRIDVNAVYSIKDFKEVRDTSALIAVIESPSVESPKKDIVNLLLKHKADINMPVNDKTPLITAVMNNNIELVKILLNYPDININQSAMHNTALGVSASKKELFNIFELLMNNEKININQQDSKMGQTPLMVAAYCKNLRAIFWLIDRNEIDLNKKDNSGQTALHYMCENFYRSCRYISISDLIKRSKFNVNEQDNEGDTLLHKLMRGVIKSSKERERARDFINRFLKECPEVNISVRNKQGYTPLHLVCSVDSPLACAMVYLLRDQGAEINVQDNEGNTPLHMVCKSSWPRDEKVRNYDSPWRFSVGLESDWSYVNTAKKLLEYTEIDINIGNNDGYTPLHIACLNKNRYIAKLLIEKGAKVYTVKNISPILFVIENFCADNSLLDTLKCIMRHIDLNQIPSGEKVFRAIDHRNRFEVSIDEIFEKKILDILYSGE